MKKNNIIMERIQNYLYSFYAKDIKYASSKEVYDALCYALMEDIGRTWVDSKKDQDGKSTDSRNEKSVYILSFEYLPGKFLKNNIRKLNKKKEVEEALNEINFSLDEILSLEKEVSLGDGDIGLASYYILNELTKLKIPTIGYALRYENGNLRQSIKDGEQTKYADYWLDGGDNWEHKKPFSSFLEINSLKVEAKTFDIPIVSDNGNFVNTLRLFKAEPIEKINYNDFSNGDFVKAYNDYIQVNSITQILYADNSSYEGKLLRLKQEYFYTYASISDIIRRHLKRFDDIESINDKAKIILSDTHPSLAIIIFIEILHDEFSVSYENAIEISRNIFDHFIYLLTSESYEAYDMNMIDFISHSLFSTINDLDEKLREEKKDQFLVKDNYIIFDCINKFLTNSCYVSSKEIYEKEKEDRKISQINLGIDRKMYAESNNKRLVSLFKNYGIENLSHSELTKLSTLKNDESFIKEISRVKLENKIDFIKKFDLDKINPYSVFDMQVGRFHEAKRQLLNALDIANRYFALKNNSNIYIRPTTFIFSGKAHDGYFIAKETIKFILGLKKLIDKDKFIKEKIKIVFVEDFNVSKAISLYPAVDIYSNLYLKKFDNNGFEMLSSAMNLSNVLTNRSGISNNLSIKNDFYYLDDFENKKIENFNATDFYYASDDLKRTIDFLINLNKDLGYDFKVIFDYLIYYNDPYDVLKDFSSLKKQRKIISRDYLNEILWNKKEINNLIWANEFYLENEEVMKILNSSKGE